jgi:hypothetical protein
MKKYKSKNKSKPLALLKKETKKKQSFPKPYTPIKMPLIKASNPFAHIPIEDRLEMIREKAEADRKIFDEHFLSFYFRYPILEL